MGNEHDSWDGAWADISVEDEIGTLSYGWVQPYLAFLARHLVPDAPVLEAGCGPGRFLYWLRERGYRAVGVDRSLAALTAAHRYSADFALALADARRLPFRTAAFGTCLSFGVVEHFPEGPDECLAEMGRVLQPGGVLIIGVPQVNVFATIAPPLKAVYRKLRRIPPPPADLEPPGRCYRARELVDALTRNRFEVIEVFPFGHAYSLHSFCGWFRKRGSHHDITPLGVRLGRALARIAPWATAFYVSMAARRR